MFDLYGWYKAGFKNVVATFGKKASKAQVEMIDTLKPKAVFIAWDKDAHDERYKFYEQNCHKYIVKIIDLPESRDADELRTQYCQK